MKKAIFVICLLTPVLFCLAQTNIWTSYRFEKRVTAIVKSGNVLYVGTNNGLVVCNTITGEYTRYNSQNSTLQYDNILSLTLAPDSSLWICTYSQLIKLSGTIWTAYNAADIGITGSISVIAFEPNGTGWFGSYNGGLLKFDGSIWTHYNSNNFGLTTECIQSLNVAPNGILWVGTDIGLFSYNGDSWTHYTNNLTPLQTVNLITFDNSGLLWCVLSGSTSSRRVLATFNGIDTWIQSCSLDYGSIYDIAFDQCNTGWLLTSEGLMVNSVTGWEPSEVAMQLYNKTQMLIDENYIKWIGTMDGVFQISELSCIEITISDNVIHGEVNKIATSNNKVWIGTYGGLCSYDGQNWDACSTLEPYFITSLYVDSSDRLWMTNSGFGVKMYDGITWTDYNFNELGLPSGSGYVAAEGRDGSIWLRTMSGLIKFYQNIWSVYDTSNSGLPSSEINWLCNDAQGNLWMIVNDSLLVKYDGESWTSIIPVINGGPWQFGAWHRRLLFCDSIGNVWVICSRHAQIGGYEFRLAKYNGSTWSVVEIPDLWSFYITCMYEDETGNIWFGTNYHGLRKLSGTVWTSYSGVDSFLNNESIKELVADSNGKIWILSYINLTVFDYPASVAKENSNETPQISFSLSNYPNPFRTATTIKYTLPDTGKVRIEVYNIKGQRVKTLINEVKENGLNEIVWDGTDKNGKPVSSGIYSCKLTTPLLTDTIKLIRVR